MKIMSKALLTLGAGLCLSATVSAQSISVGTASGAPGGPTTPATIPVTFTRNASAPVADFAVRVSYPVANLTVATVAGANGGSCSNNGMGGFVTVLPPAGQTDLATNPYCNITFTINAGAPAPSTQNLTVAFAPGGNCIDSNATTVVCSLSNGSVSVTSGGSPVGPNLAYAPAAGASAGTGGPVNFTGVTTVGSTGAGTIAVTPSGGSNSGTTTLGSFSLTGADAANFAVTSAATLTFTAGVNTAQNVTMTCTSGAAARTANLQATETITGGATSQRFWVLSCPAGSAAGTPPTITYNPAAGSTSNVAAGANLLINVGCPTDGSPCNGSGTGNAATARLQSLAAVYTGLASPSPSMACNFVSEGGAVIGSPLDFVALAADPGDIRCTCPMNTTGLPTETFRIDVTEISPIGGTSTVRQFNVVCGAPPPACGTLAANPASGTINLTNGGAATTVSTFTLTGAGAGVTNTITCATSGVSAGTAFTITTSPSPLTLANNASGTVSASCTNSEQTTGTGTLTCTATSTGQSCMPPSFTYTLSCPGQSAPPPPGESVPVPAMSEQGRILLAALVLLLGLGVVGFRMRG